MDEYYCPKCGASLNDQSGFDPSKGTWTCTECGEHLMDDDVYEGDTYQGVAWYCDKCGALLNRQTGFTDSGSSWKCTECGHVNGTTEDDIIDYVFTCPNCGATLNTQWGFDKYADNHECSSCGVKLHHSYSDDEYSIVEEDTGPSCPNCGAKLNDQFCFADYKDDWECTECGAHLHHSYSWESYTVVEDKNKFICPNCDAELNDQFCFADYEDDWICTECGAHLHHDYSSDPYVVVCNDDTEDDRDVEPEDDHAIDADYYDIPNGKTIPVSGKPTEKLHKAALYPKKSLQKIRTKAFFFKFKKIQIGYDCTALLYEDIGAVYAALYNKAFSNIKKIPIKDIYIGSPYQEGEVKEVIVNGNALFGKEDMIPYDAEIIITYHEKREITLPFHARTLKKRNHGVVAELFRELGFTEIKEIPLKDLTTGWIAKNGSVTKVTIAGDDSFKRNSVHKYDVKVEIRYHSFKKNRT